MTAVVAKAIPRSRQRVLLDELQHAIGKTDSEALRRWGVDSASLLGTVFARRGRNFGGALLGLMSFARREAVDAYDASRQGRGMDHAIARGHRAVEVLTFAGQRAVNAGRELAAEIRTSPREAGPKLAVSTLAFLAASGGVDGDGGVPDLDLLAGIGAHRSIFTHSIISGAVIETLLGSTATLVSLIHHNLPEDHDSMWDAVNDHKDHYLQCASKGASLGIAYHLFIDSALQPAAYHDIPVEMPIEGHQAIMGANAAAEGIDAVKRDSQHVIVNCPNCSQRLRLPAGKILEARCVPCGYAFRLQT